jgi:1,4-alpha-glucan branching enzyme
MQSSDWPFSVTTGPARDYADQRFSAHFADFKRLIHIAKLAQEHGQLDQDEQTFVAEKEQQDFLFPTLEDVLFL